MKKGSKVNEDHFRVAIFGSARLKKNDPRYKLVYSLAQMLAKQNIDVVTGGGPGLMDAASRGHHKGRGKNNHSHSVGLSINLPFEKKDGYHLDIKRDFDKFSGRLDTFMQLSNVVVVAPGGIGTALELFYTWQLVQVKHICNTPIILLGDMWKPLISWVKKEMVRKGLVSKEDLEPIFIAKNCTDVMKIVTKARKEFEAGGKNVCRNIKKYV